MESFQTTLHSTNERVNIRNAKGIPETLLSDKPFNSKMAESKTTTSLTGSNGSNSASVDVEMGKQSPEASGNAIVPKEQNSSTAVVLDGETKEGTTVQDSSAPPTSPSGEATTKLNDNLPFKDRLWDVVRQFPYMACTAFGGPAMAVTLQQKRFVDELKWLDEGMFKELFALCQGFPGPTQGLMAVCIGTLRAGLVGGVVALLIYCLPGFFVMTLFGCISYVYFDPNQQNTPDWMSGLGPAAISLLFLACFKLGKTHCMASKLRMILGLLSAIGTLLVVGDPRVNRRWSALMFPAYLLAGGISTFVDSRRKGRLEHYYKKKAPNASDADLIRKINISKPCGALMIILWLAILVTFVVLRSQDLLSKLGQLFESLFRVGSMIFGGGYVVLPMLLQEQIVSENQFFQGFALVQALPGPLFNFSAFLGAASLYIPGAFVGALGLFMPGTMLLLGFMPYWTILRKLPGYKAFIAGVSATAIGFVAAACVELWELAVHKAADAIVFMSVGVAVGFFDASMPLSILFGGLLGFSFSPSALNLGQKPFCPPSTGNGTYVVG